MILALPAAGWPEKEKSYSVIAGSVFRDPGFSLPGVAIELIEVRSDGKKPKVQKAVTDSRGEFAFRMPAQETKFKVRAAAKGLQKEEKDATSVPGARIDVFFTLKPASN